MTTHAMVMTAVGPDRPGLVEQFSALIHEHDCNLEDSRMAILAGEFAIILLFSGSEAAVEQVREASAANLEEKLGFRVTFKSTERKSVPPQRAYSLRVSGADQRGIVRRVGEVLSNLNINVASFESQLEHAAFSGTPMFSIHAKLQLKEDGQAETLREGLREAGAALDLVVDLTSE